MGSSPVTVEVASQYLGDVAGYEAKVAELESQAADAAAQAEAALARVRSEFEPPQEVGELASNMPFADYLLEWLDIVKVRVKATTFSSYEQMVKSVIEPYFRKKALTLQGLEARHIQQFYSEKQKTVKPN